MINKDGGGAIFRFYGGHSCYEGRHRAHGGPPSPPTGENPGIRSFNLFHVFKTFPFPRNFTYYCTYRFTYINKKCFVKSFTLKILMSMITPGFVFV